MTTAKIDDNIVHLFQQRPQTILSDITMTKKMDRTPREYKTTTKVYFFSIELFSRTSHANSRGMATAVSSPSSVKSSWPDNAFWPPWPATHLLQYNDCRPHSLFNGKIHIPSLSNSTLLKILCNCCYLANFSLPCSSASSKITTTTSHNKLARSDPQHFCPLCRCHKCSQCHRQEWNRNSHL